MQQLTTLLKRTPVLRGPARSVKAIYRRAVGAPSTAFDRVLPMLEAALGADPVVRLPEFGGSFETDVRSHLFRRVVLQGYYEPEIAELARKHVDPNRDALDVGANIGFFSVLLAQLLDNRRVVAVEPTRAAGERLRRNLCRNGVEEKVTILRCAIADQPGTATIGIVPGREEYSSLGKLEHPAIVSESSQTETVETKTVDAVAAEHGLDLGFVKIDVEGMEHLILRGAGETLSKARPVFLCELNPLMLEKNGSSAQEVLDFFATHSYDVTDAEHPSRPPGQAEFGEVLCVPRRS